jgi:TPR repeat protein
MLVERQKSFAMRIYRRIAELIVLFALMLGAGAGAASARDVKFVSPEAALEQGLAAFRGGYYDIAIPALSFAAEKGLFYGQFYLAQIYADDSLAYTNHPKAYDLYRRIAEEHANIDPDDDPRAPHVARALSAVGKYVRRGLEPIGLRPNAERAAEFLRAAATYFGDSDAQFELAKMYLKGEGVIEDRSLAFHWLSTLTQQGHAGAQAFLADLLWRGKDLPRDERRALALITVAVANAPAADRIWIEDVYQNIFCGTSAGTRQQAEGLVAVWKRIYAPKAPIEDDERLVLAPSARQCGSGETLPMPERASRQVFERKTGAVQPDGGSVVRDKAVMQGGAASGPASIPLREVGATKR